MSLKCGILQIWPPKLLARIRVISVSTKRCGRFAASALGPPPNLFKVTLVNKLAESIKPSNSCSSKKKMILSPTFHMKGRGWLAIICLAILATHQLHQLHSHTFGKTLSYFTFPEYSPCLLTLPLL